MVFGAHTYREFVRLLGPGTKESGVGDAWVTRMRNLAGDSGVVHARRPPRLAGRDRRERRRRRRRRPPQGGVRGAVALARQPVDEPGADGHAAWSTASTSRSSPSSPVGPVRNRSCGGGRLRPRTDREPDARWPYPGAHLPAHPALTCTDSDPGRAGAPAAVDRALLGPGTARPLGAAGTPEPYSRAVRVAPACVPVVPFPASASSSPSRYRSPRTGGRLPEADAGTGGTGHGVKF